MPATLGGLVVQPFLVQSGLADYRVAYALPLPMRARDYAPKLPRCSSNDEIEAATLHSELMLGDHVRANDDVEPPVRSYGNRFQRL